MAASSPRGAAGKASATVVPAHDRQGESVLLGAWYPPQSGTPRGEGGPEKDSPVHAAVLATATAAPSFVAVLPGH